MEQWRPAAPEGESVDDLPLNEWVGQALGTASMCWTDVAAAGEFDSARAGWVLQGLMAHLNAVIDGVIAGTAAAVACPPDAPCQSAVLPTDAR